MFQTFSIVPRLECRANQSQIIALLRIECAKMRGTFERRNVFASLRRFENSRSEHYDMPRKRKKKIFSAAKVVREMARERVGSPKASQLVAAKKTKPERHKPTLGKLLTDE